MFDEQTSGSMRARASWTAAAMTPLFPGATCRPAQSADLSAHSKNLSCHPVKKYASFCAIYDLLPSPNATRVIGITYKFRIRKNAQNFSSKTSWRSSTCENPPQVNKGNCPQKNSEFFCGHFYGKPLANQQKITKKTPQNHAKKSRFLTHFSHGGLLANPQKIPQKTRPKNCKYCAKIKPTPHPANLSFFGKNFARVSVQTSDGLTGMGIATVPVAVFGVPAEHPVFRLLRLLRQTRFLCSLAEFAARFGVCMKPVLEISNLKIQRDGVRILDGVDWCVERGQHWAILGANGSGKTSLLSALTGYLMPTSGEIVLLGKKYGRADWRELRKKIGIVSSAVRQMMAPGEPALETVVSGKFAMIDFWGRLSAADRNRALKILRQIECAHLAERPWRVLSQGERQRILIGRALMARPRMLILDEPCAGLDPAAREHFLQFLQRLGRGKNAPTLALVTHHVEEIMPVFSRALILKHGKTLASGEKGETITVKNLSDAFGTKLRLQFKNGRFTMKILPRKGAVV